jgi:hypothetical protein
MYMNCFIVQIHDLFDELENLFFANNQNQSSMTLPGLSSRVIDTYTTHMLLWPIKEICKSILLHIMERISQQTRNM